MRVFWVDRRLPPCLMRHSTTAQTIRELCRKLKPLGAWDTVEAHGSVKQLPVLNIDLLAHSHNHPDRQQCALKTMVVRACLTRGSANDCIAWNRIGLTNGYFRVFHALTKKHAQRLSRELPQFFRDNPLTVGTGKNKHYKYVGLSIIGDGCRSSRVFPNPPFDTTHDRPPQRHLANQTLLGDANYRTPFLDFFVAGPLPLGVTDVGQVCSLRCLYSLVYVPACKHPKHHVTSSHEIHRHPHDNSLLTACSRSAACPTCPRSSWRR